MFDVYAPQAVSGPNTSTLSHCTDMAWNHRCSDHFQNSQKRDSHREQTSFKVTAPRRRRGPLSPELTSELHHTKELQPNPKGSVVPKVDVGAPGEETPTKSRGSPDQQDTRMKTCHPDSGDSNTKFYHRFRGLTTVARDRVVSRRVDWSCNGCNRESASSPRT